MELEKRKVEAEIIRPANNSEDDDIRCPGCGEYFDNDESQISEFYYYEAECPKCHQKFLFTKCSSIEFVYFMEADYKIRKEIEDVETES